LDAFLFWITLAWKESILEQNSPENIFGWIDAEICAKALVESAPIIVHARGRAANRRKSRKEGRRRVW
jgi:hypothetical protein